MQEVGYEELGGRIVQNLDDVKSLVYVILDTLAWEFHSFTNDAPKLKLSHWELTLGTGSPCTLCMNREWNVDKQFWQFHQKLFGLMPVVKNSSDCAVYCRNLTYFVSFWTPQETQFKTLSEKGTSIHLELSPYLNQRTWYRKDSDNFHNIISGIYQPPSAIKFKNYLKCHNWFCNWLARYNLILRKDWVLANKRTEKNSILVILICFSGTVIQFRISYTYGWG